jgi:hypothetical protein
MSEHRRVAIGDELGCAFCTELLASDDCIASIRIASRAHGHHYLGAHVKCLERVIRPELASRIDLADVPPGLDHFLALPA